MPLSVETPAPVRTVMLRAAVSQPGSGSGTSPVTPSTVGADLVRQVTGERSGAPGAALRS
jgi:hypothetical protein